MLRHQLLRFTNKRHHPLDASQPGLTQPAYRSFCNFWLTNQQVSRHFTRREDKTVFLFWDWPDFFSNFFYVKYTQLSLHMHHFGIRHQFGKNAYNNLTIYTCPQSLRSLKEAKNYKSPPRMKWPRNSWEIYKPFFMEEDTFTLTFTSR